MTRKQAADIARLLNQRNQLARLYDSRAVLKRARDYEFESRDGRVVACIDRHEVQWYQWEFCHLSVDLLFEGQHIASTLYDRAEAFAAGSGACIIQVHDQNWERGE